jgi:hypothetical protein
VKNAVVNDLCSLPEKRQIRRRDIPRTESWFDGVRKSFAHHLQMEQLMRDPHLGRCCGGSNANNRGAIVRHYGLGVRA